MCIQEAIEEARIGELLTYAKLNNLDLVIELTSKFEGVKDDLSDIKKVTYNDYLSFEEYVWVPDINLETGIVSFNCVSKDGSSKFSDVMKVEMGERVCLLGVGLVKYIMYLTGYEGEPTFKLYKIIFQ
ncbi:MAG: hypothetical protein IBX57_00680 [Gammaproteobacteria bacterium]|nr:hypothetical protein [Gammaproteobacteria bacterium]